MILSSPLFAQAADETAEDSSSDMVDKDLYYFYGLDEQLDVNVDVASLFEEDEFVVGSSVTSISSNRWRMQGARRTYDALENALSVFPYNLMCGAVILAVREYATLSSISGTAILFDGVPVNAVSIWTSSTHLPNWELGTLDKIKMIKGPESAIYGTDAFHGVVSMKTFESDKKHYSVDGAGADFIIKQPDN